MKRVLLVSFAAWTLVACQQSSTVRDSAAGDVYRNVEGASLVLNQDLRVAAGKARVFVQDGAVVSGFNSYKPHCAFEIDSVRHDGVAIQADTFVISRVQASTQQVVSAEPVRLAALLLADGMGDGGGGSASYYEGYHFWLTSANQPNVRRMSCYGVYAQPYELYPPTLEEIRQLLGEIAEIRQ
jgi:hypothetical protein